MAWVVIANLKGVPGDAASLAELANRPKSTVPSLASGTNFNMMHQKEHVGWWGFISTNVTNEPPGMGTSVAMLEVLAPEPYAAVQRVHDRNARITWERSIISAADNTWSTWRAFTTSDKVMSILGVIGTSETVKGNVDDYRLAEHLGVWTLWGPYNNSVPKDVRGRCTLEVLRDSNGSTTQRLSERESGRIWSRTYSSSWSRWTDLTNRGPLTPFWNAVAESKSRSVNVVVVGDSNGEGVMIENTITERWINKLQSALNRVAGNWQGAQFPFIPAKYGLDDTPPMQPVTLEGSYVSGSYVWGYGWRTATLRDTTSKATFTFIGTSASVMYVEGANGGLMDISVDGGPVTVVNTKSSSTNASRRWNTGDLGFATHTVTVTWNSANTAGDYVYLEGLLTWNNDENRGVRIIDASRSGRRMTDVTTERANYLARAITETGNVELVIVNLATNDARDGATDPDYRTAAEGIVSMLRTYGISVPVVFVLPYVGADHTRETLNFYGGILGNTASNIRGVHFVDLSLAMPKIPDDRSLPVAQGLYADHLHMRSDGHTAFAGHMLRALKEG